MTLDVWAIEGRLQVFTILTFSTHPILTLNSRCSQPVKHYILVEEILLGSRVMSRRFEVKRINDEVFVQCADSLIESQSYRSINCLYPILQDCIIKKCLNKGRILHTLIAMNGLEKQTFWGSHLIRMYASCRSLLEMEQIFENLSPKNVFTWSITILAHVRIGDAEKAIELYNLMQISNINPNQCVYVAIIKACAVSEFLSEGMLIHCRIIEEGLVGDAHVGSILIDMYSRCGNLSEAERVLELLPSKNAVIWNSMLAGYAQHGNVKKVIQVFLKMIQDGVRTDRVTYLGILKAISVDKSLSHVMWEIHQQIVEEGFHVDVFLCTTLIDAYFRSGKHIEDAWALFYALPSRTTATWNAMITGLVQNGYSQEVFHLFQLLQQVGIQPDSNTYTGIAKACANALALGHGKFVHAVVYNSIWRADTFIGSALIGMYITCAKMQEACSLFEILSVKTVVIWNALISGYLEHGDIQKAFELFQRMLLEDVEPDKVTFMNLLKACSIVCSLNMVLLVHSFAIQHGLQNDLSVGNALIEIYCKSGSLAFAREVFDALPIRNAVIWNTMILGYYQKGDVRMSFQLFQEMYTAGIEPDEVTYSSILQACLGTTFLEHGRLVHFLVVCSGDEDLVVCHCLVNMYAKCGDIADARRVFDGLTDKNIISWNTMVSAYAQNADYPMALKFFQLMELEGIRPNHLTFSGLLSACSRAALMKEACNHIISMWERYGIEPSIAHLYYIVDINARMGCLNEAQAIIETMPNLELFEMGFLSLLSCSEIYGRVQEARILFNRAAMLEQ